MGSAGAAGGSPDIFGPSMSPSLSPPVISGVFVVCPCSPVMFCVSPESSSHLRPFHRGKSSVCSVNLALLGNSFSSDSRISGFFVVILRANMDISFTRFRFGVSGWCILSFIHFFSGYLSPMIGVRNGEASRFHTYLLLRLSRVRRCRPPKVELPVSGRDLCNRRTREGD
jgi:hypothetical protein